MNPYVRPMVGSPTTLLSRCGESFGGCLLLVLPAVMLAGCGSVPASPERLTSLLREQVRYLPDKHLDTLVEEMRSKEMVFLGEVHGVPALHRVADDLVAGLASIRPVVYAWEGCYSVGPFYEAASLGVPNPLSPQQPIPPQIVAFNSTNLPARKILVTAVDVEHPIYHSKEHPVRYLTEMAGRSTSAAAREALGVRTPRLTATRSYDEVQDYLREIKGLFEEHAATFSPADQEEVRFALNLFEASNRYQHAFRGLIETAGNPENIRLEYYIKTIERARQKARERDAILVSRVGNWHTSLFVPCEAKHFAIDDPATKGKVMTLQMLPVYQDGTNESNQGIDLVAAVKPLMKPGCSCYLALPRMHGGARRALKYSRYFPGNRPVCDGILFVNATRRPVHSAVTR